MLNCVSNFLLIFFFQNWGSQDQTYLGAIWKLDLGYPSPFSEVLPGWIDTCRQSNRQFGQKLLTCQDVTFLGHYGLLRHKYNNQYAVGGEEAFSSMVFLLWCGHLLQEQFRVIATPLCYISIGTKLFKAVSRTTLVLHLVLDTVRHQQRGSDHVLQSCSF